MYAPSLERLIERLEVITTDYALPGESLLFWIDAQPIYVDRAGRISTSRAVASLQINLSEIQLTQFLDDTADPLLAYHQAKISLQGDLATAHRLYQAYFWS